MTGVQTCALPISCVASVGGLLPAPPSWRYLIGFGVLDALGYVLYVTAAQGSVAIAAVATSQEAAVAVLGGILLLKERLSSVQVVGVVTLLLSVGAVAAQG